jgi:hypothetical protein
MLGSVSCDYDACRLLGCDVIYFDTNEHSWGNLLLPSSEQNCDSHVHVLKGRKWNLNKANSEVLCQSAPQETEN